MTVIARDAVASDHLVYAWPFPLGPECEVTCADDEQVVMCPSWLVGDRLGPGRHRWRTPDPMRPVAAFFVLTSPVEVAFDLMTSFLIPASGQPVRLRATGSIQVRCADPGLLIAQFVGLPFDNVNDGILRSVSRSVERMLARLLTRRVVMSGTPLAVTDPQMLGSIIEELVAYNPTAGAVFGVELIRMGHLTVAADDGSTPYLVLPPSDFDWSGGHAQHTPTPPPPPNGDSRGSQPNLPQHMHEHEGVSLLETQRGRATSHHDAPTPPPLVKRAQVSPPAEAALGAAATSGVIAREPLAATSGEIAVRAKKPTEPGLAIGTTPPGSPKVAAAVVIDVPRSRDEITQPNMTRTPAPAPGSMRAFHTPESGTAPEVSTAPRGGIMGIGMAGIGASSVAGEIPAKVAPGTRVLVPGPNGLMQSATVRQLLQGYYELEVGSSGETIWVPIGGVVPE